MRACWIDLSIGEIIEEDGKKTSDGEETVVFTELPVFTERSEITSKDNTLLYINGEMEIALHNMLSISIQRINNLIQERVSQETPNEGKENGDN